MPGGWAEEKRERSRLEKGRAAESCSSSSEQRLLRQQPGSCCHLLMRGGAEKVGITSSHTVSETVSRFLLAPATMFYSHFCFASTFKGSSPCPCSSFSSLPCWCCPPLSAPCCLTPELCQAPSCGCKAHADVQLGLDPTPQRDLPRPQQQISPQAWRKGALHQAQLQAAGLVPRCSERVRGTSGENGNEGLQS